MNLTVKLEIYEGPLDLLLHLIKKNEVDIYDIPIALITAQYLEYIDLMESLNVDLAGEFLLMAATLTQIKSKMLLPKLNDEEDSEEEDPRMAIVRPLLEHMRLKEAAEVLERRTVLNRDVFSRKVDLKAIGLEVDKEEYVEANLFDLIDAFRSIVSRFQKKAGLEIIIETKTIQERMQEVLEQVKAAGRMTFMEICQTDRSKAELILSFLTVLELARNGLIRLFQHQVTLEITVFHMAPEPVLHSRDNPVFEEPRRNDEEGV